MIDNSFRTPWDYAILALFALGLIIACVIAKRYPGTPRRTKIGLLCVLLLSVGVCSAFSYHTRGVQEQKNAAIVQAMVQDNYHFHVSTRQAKQLVYNGMLDSWNIQGTHSVRVGTRNTAFNNVGNKTIILMYKPTGALAKKYSGIEFPTYPSKIVLHLKH